ncbi:MAG: DUF2848 domain-containing protein [Alphaproteobacteria bacterium]
MACQAKLNFECVAKTGAGRRVASIGQLVIAGWTGRNKPAMEAHIKELEALGVKRPKSTPIYYRVASSLLTTEDEIQVSGGKSSGEVEFVLFSLADGLWITVGSDHTDREAETVNVSLSKQMCAKPVGATVWRFDEVLPHWDKLMLRAYATIGGQRALYQEGPVTTMLDPRELMQGYAKTGLSSGTAMFCGTLPAHGGIRPAEKFEIELDDPVMGRKIAHAYRIVPLPVEG